MRVKAKRRPPKKRAYVKGPRGKIRADGTVDNPRSRFDGRPRAHRIQYLAEADLRRLARRR